MGRSPTHAWRQSLQSTSGSLPAISAARQSDRGLTIQEYDLINGKIRITKAIVLGRHEDHTKTGEDGPIDLYGRAL